LLYALLLYNYVLHVLAFVQLRRLLAGVLLLLHCCCCCCRSPCRGQTSRYSTRQKTCVRTRYRERLGLREERLASYSFVTYVLETASACATLVRKFWRHQREASRRKLVGGC
ncbi:unnamed protein product, partial [Ascophyllum nodosum]